MAVNPDARRRLAYLLLDEIRTIPERQHIVRRVLDTE